VLELNCGGFSLFFWLSSIYCLCPRAFADCINAWWWSALRQKSWAILGSALPPDVRRWLCPDVEVPFRTWGYALGAAYGPVDPKGQARTRGIAREQSSCCRRGKPVPNIRRHSRRQHQRRTLRAKPVHEV